MTRFISLRERNELEGRLLEIEELINNNNYFNAIDSIKRLYKDQYGSNNITPSQTDRINYFRRVLINEKILLEIESKQHIGVGYTNFFGMLASVVVGIIVGEFTGSKTIWGLVAGLVCVCLISKRVISNQKKDEMNYIYLKAVNELLSELDNMCRRR